MIVGIDGANLVGMTRSIVMLLHATYIKKNILLKQQPNKIDQPQHIQDK